MRSIFGVNVCKIPRVWDRARVEGRGSRHHCLLVWNSEEPESPELEPGLRLQVPLRDLKGGAEVSWWGLFQPGRNLTDTLKCFLRWLVSGEQRGRDPEEGEQMGVSFVVS